MSKTVPINILHLNSDGKRKSWNDQNFTNIFNHKLNFKTKPVGKNCNDSLMELFDGVGKKKRTSFRYLPWETLAMIFAISFLEKTSTSSKTLSISIGDEIFDMCKTVVKVDSISMSFNTSL